MQISSRASLVWANKGLEAAADVIVADFLRAAEKAGVVFNEEFTLSGLASSIDPQPQD